MNKKYILAIETSCDETSAAIVLDGRTIVSNVIFLQVPLHQRYGGVVPEIASRKHIEHVLPVVDKALVEANLKLSDLSGIGVTYGPGLVGALLVGVSVAKALTFALDIPLIGVNHLEGHIFANFLAHPELEPPFVALIVSGGHTALVHVKGYNSFELLGQTRDDAAGEAFDKIARIMGLPYPGGPRIDALAKQGNKQAIEFPRAFQEKGNLEFSFSGLKSAVINYLHNSEQRKAEIQVADVAASFQAAVVDVLVDKTLQAAKLCKTEKIVLAGGVAANSALRAELAAKAQESKLKVYAPTPILCTDNGAMIACRAYYMYREELFSDLTLNAVPSLKLTSVENCNHSIVDTVNN